MEALVGGLEAHQPRELDGAERGDVGDGEAVAGHPGLALQLGVEPGGGLAGLCHLRVAEIGKLRLLQRCQARVRVADGVGHGQHEVPLHAPVGHLDEGTFLGVLPIRLGVG